MNTILGVPVFYLFTHSIFFGYGCYLINLNDRCNKLNKELEPVVASLTSGSSLIHADEQLLKKYSSTCLAVEDPYTKTSGIVLLLKSLLEIGMAIFLLFLLKKKNKRLLPIWINIRMVLPFVLIGWITYLHVAKPKYRETSLDKPGIRVTIGLVVSDLLTIVDVHFFLWFIAFINSYFMEDAPGITNQQQDQLYQGDGGPQMPYDQGQGPRYNPQQQQGAGADPKNLIENADPAATV